MPPRIDFPPAQLADVLRRYEAGWSARRLGASLGVDGVVILRILREHGVTIRPRSEAKRKLTRTQEAELVRQRREDGLTRADLMARWGVGADVVGRALRRAGAARKSRPQRHLSPEEEAQAEAMYVAEKLPAPVIARRLGASPSHIKAVLDRRGVQARPLTEAMRKHSFDEAAFDSPAGPEVMYWVGMMFTDGTVNDRREWSPSIALRLAEGDRAHVEAFRVFLRGTQPVYRVERVVRLPNGQPKHSVCYGLTVTSSRLAAALGRFGVLPRKSEDAAACFRGGAERSADAWRGAVDGDGTIGLYRDAADPSVLRASLSVLGTFTLARQFADFVRPLVPKYRGAPCREKGLWKLCLTGGSAMPVIRALYGHGGPALARKAAIAATILGRCDESGKATCS